MDHFVVLDRVPEGLQFPPDLAEQVHLDPETRRLSFRGFMTKSDYDRLCLLSEDWPFRRKLEDLFRQCTLAAECPRRRAPGGWLAGAAVAGLVSLAAWWFWPRPAAPTAGGGAVATASAADRAP